MKYLPCVIVALVGGLCIGAGFYGSLQEKNGWGWFLFVGFIIETIAYDIFVRIK